MADSKLCPCCQKPVPAAELKFQIFRDNDAQEVFRVTEDRRLVWAPDIDVQEGAREFAKLVNDLFAKHS